jgi:hypothetical protein
MPKWTFMLLIVALIGFIAAATILIFHKTAGGADGISAANSQPRDVQSTIAITPGQSPPNPNPIHSDVPPIVELSTNYRALTDQQTPAQQMAFHGIKLGDPQSTAMALSGSQIIKANLIENDTLHACFETNNGVVNEIDLFDPSLAGNLNIGQQDDVQMEFGKADDSHPSEAAEFSGDENGGTVYEYFSRHLRVICRPNPDSGGTPVALTVILHE